MKFLWISLDWAFNLSLKASWVSKVTAKGYLNFKSEFMAIIGSDPIITVAVILLFWAVVEAWLIKVFKTTPGKFLLNTYVKSDIGVRIPFLQSLKRSLQVYIAGIGIGIPIISQFAMAWQYYLTRKNGKSKWDEKLQMKVVHFPLGKVRVLLMSLILMAVLLINLKHMGYV